MEPRETQPAQKSYAPDMLQRIAIGTMAVLAVVSFIGANLQAILWQSSEWLVSTVLPAVVVELTNEERADLAEAPLRRSVVLDEAARLKAEHMAKNQYFAHYAPDGTSPWHWFDEAGYVYAHAGENLAIHFTDSSEVVEAWMNSPKHRENIVNDNFTEIGVGTAKGEFEGYSTVYVVQLFGTPAQAPAPFPVAEPEVETLPPVPEPAELSSLNAASTEIATTESQPVEVLGTVATASAPALAEVVPTSTEAVVVAATGTLATAETPAEDSVIIESSMIATSSGLAVATMYSDSAPNRSYSLFGMATKPNDLLQILYGMLGVFVVGLLIASVVVEIRRMRFVQVAYGFGLLALMGGLWFVHMLLTAGAVIV